MGIEIPPRIIEALGKSKKPPVIVTVGSHSWRSTVASMGGKYLVGIAKEHRATAGIRGDETELTVTLELDTARRDVEVPTDLSSALEAEGLREAFELLPPSARKELVRQIQTAKADDTRLRRIAKALDAARARV